MHRSLVALLALFSFAAHAEDFAYGTASPAQRLAFHPTKTANAPLVVYFHGGAWVVGSRDEFASLGRAFAANGFHVAVVDYRLSSESGVRHPMHAQDGAAAVQWLFQRSKRFSFDPKAIYLVGHSAGAHLAATLAVDSSLQVQSKVAGVVTTEGIFDLPQLSKDFPGYDNWFLNAAFGEDRSRWKAASPRFGKMPPKMPWLVLHSDADSLVNVRQSEDFAKAMGPSARFQKLASLEHDEVTTQLSTPGSTVWNAVLEFLRKH